MNKVNYEREMEKLLAQIQGQDEKKSLLLHACCAPCASACVEKLKDYFDITLYFYNPNMDSESEYLSRAKEVVRLSKYFNVEYVIEDYLGQEFLTCVSGLQNEKEGGSRCEKCFCLRLNKSANFAKVNGFDYFATTLTLSPLKNAQLLNQIGRDIGQSLGVKYLCSDFKKKNGYIRSIELSNELNLYRQNYCGCIFSKSSRQ